MSAYPADIIPEPIGIDSVGKLREWIAALLVQQSEHMEFAADFEEHAWGRLFTISDDADRQAAWDEVIGFVARMLYGRIVGAWPCEIAWRIKPEFEAVEYSPLERLDPDGPDRDPITDQRGWARKGTAIVKTYLRFALRPTGAAL